MEQNSKEAMPNESPITSNASSDGERPPEVQANPNQVSGSSESSSKENEAELVPIDTLGTNSPSKPHNSETSKRSSDGTLGQKSRSESLTSQQLRKAMSQESVGKNTPTESKSLKSQASGASIGNKSKSGSLKSQGSRASIENKSKSKTSQNPEIPTEQKPNSGTISSQNVRAVPTEQKMDSQIPEFCSEECVYEGNRCHAKRFAYYLETGLESDVTILVGENKTEIKAHKLILMIGSSVLRALLCEDRSRTTYEITDTRDDVFLLMLQYLYTGEVEIKVDNAIPLLEAAEKYHIPDLSVVCSVFLKSTLTNETAIPLFQQARKFTNSYLEKGALDIICKNASSTVESDEFLDLETQNLGKILEQDNLAVFDEMQLFDAVMRWAKAECKRKGKEPIPKNFKSILKPIINLIRFPQMDSGDFSMKVAEAGVLGVEELVSVLLYYNVKDERKANIPTGTFNPHPRKYFSPSGDKYIIQRLRPALSCYCSIPMTNSPHSIKLKVSKSIWISSIGLNKSSKRTCSDNLQVKLKIEDFTNKKILCKKKITLESPVEFCETYHIEFDKPVLLKVDLWHIISFRIASGNYYGRNYESVDFDYNNNNNNRKMNDPAQVGTSTIHYHCKGGQEVWFHFEDFPSSKYTTTKMGYLPEFSFQIN